MKTALPFQVLDLTSFSIKSYHPQSERELRSGNNRKSERDMETFHSHGIYPVSTPLGISSGVMKNQKKIPT